MSPLTFIIPIRHPDGVGDEPLQQRVLARTFRAIAARPHSGWRARIDRNSSQRPTEPPPGFEVVAVDISSVHETSENLGDLETFIDAIDIDKDRRMQAAFRDAVLHRLCDSMDIERRHEGMATAFLPQPFSAAVSSKGRGFASRELLLQHAFREHMQNRDPRRRSNHSLRGWRSWAPSYLDVRPFNPRLRRGFFGRRLRAAPAPPHARADTARVTAS